MNSLKIVNKEHPRLFINSEWLKNASELSEKDKFFIQLKDNLLKKANLLLNEKPVEFKITGPRMLNNCQEILMRIATLALSYHLDKNPDYAKRAKDELLSAANFPHWNKDHFLDTAELITAFAIGYDWFYHVLPETDLNTVKSAVINKGLKVGLEEYKNNVWWAQHQYNWNQVCNGGMIIGSLAIADEEPQLFDEVIEASSAKLQIAFNSYGKEGGWEAGPDYWQYTTWYSALLIDALSGVTGNDLGLSKTVGLDKTGFFAVYAAGSTDRYFNFADADEKHSALPVLFWLGRKFNHNELINENHRLLKKSWPGNTDIDPFQLVWYAPPSENIEPLPLDKVFTDINVGFMRSDWNNAVALSVAYKGGNNQADHAHLDLGSFVFDMHGVRWASDLGRDNYDLPGYWDFSEGGGRWKYFRLNTKSHNTLVLNSDNQRAQATANIINFQSFKNASYAEIDLSQAYVPHAKSVVRKIKLIRDYELVIHDKIEWNTDQRSIQWQLLTQAEICLLGRKALLIKDDKVICASIVQPDDAIFETASPEQNEPEQKNEGYNMLIIKKSEIGMTTEIIVSFSSNIPDKKTI